MIRGNPATGYGMPRDIAKELESEGLSLRQRKGGMTSEYTIIYSIADFPQTKPV